MDVVDSSTRSRMMSSIRGKNTLPERQVRRYLHCAGLRFRLHSAGLPGKPDLVLPRYRAVIMVHGCFWHRHGGCRFCTTPATRPEFWHQKFARNVQRDAEKEAELQGLGWTVFTVWECETSDELALDQLFWRIVALSDERGDDLGDPRAARLNGVSAISPKSAGVVVRDKC